MVDTRIAEKSDVFCQNVARFSTENGSKSWTLNLQEAPNMQFFGFLSKVFSQILQEITISLFTYPSSTLLHNPTPAS